MLKFYLPIIFLLLCACASVTDKRIDNLSSFPRCFVKWSRPEYREKYLAGKNHSLAYKQTQDLLIPLWLNEGIYVVSQQDQTLGVKFDPSDANLKEEIYAVLDEHFIYDRKRERNTMMQLQGMTFKMNPEKVSDLIKNYEEVDCQAYAEAQTL